MKSVYLDNQTEARPLSRILEQMLSLQREQWELSAMPEVREQFILSTVNKAERSISAQLGMAEQDAFLFAHSGEEAIDKLFLATYLDLVRETGRTHFLTLPGEISAIDSAGKRMEKLGCTVKTLPLNAQGQVTRAVLEEHIRARTALVSLSWAHPLTGVIQPISDLGEVCKEKGVKLHVDASAVLGKLFFRFQNFNIDFLTFDGRALHAPTGAAGLIVKAGSLLNTLKESALSPTAPAAMLQALALAIDELQQSLDHVCLETARLRNKLEEELKAHLPDVMPLFADSERVPHISALAFPGVHAEALHFLLNRQGIYARVGGEALVPLLTACGMDSTLAHTTLSFALSYETSDAEIDYVIEKIIAAVHKLRQGSRCLV